MNGGSGVSIGGVRILRVVGVHLVRVGFLHFFCQLFFFTLQCLYGFLYRTLGLIARQSVGFHDVPGCMTSFTKASVTPHGRKQHWKHVLSFNPILAHLR